MRQTGSGSKGKPAGYRLNITLDSVLRRLILMCVMPLVLLAIYLSIVHVLHIRTESRERAVAMVHNITTTLDGNLKLRIAGMQVLAASPLTSEVRYLPLLYEEALGFTRHFGGQVVLADESMQMLFNTRSKFGSILPTLPRPRGFAAVPYALKNGKPAVGDMFPGPIAKKPLVAIAVPVASGGKVRLILLDTIELRWLQTLLDELVLPADWTVKIHDSQHALLASRVGGKALSGLDAIGGEESWVLNSNVAPWVVTLAIPRSTFLQPLATTSATIIALILLSTLISIVLGRLTGRRLSGAMESLEHTGAVADGKLPVIREVEAVRLALQDERDFRQSAETALRESEARWSFAIEGAGDGLWDWDVASGSIFFSVRWKQMLGFDEADVANHLGAWTGLVHPDDRDRVMAAVQGHFDGKTPEFVSEYRMGCKDGSWKWILARGMAFNRDANGNVLRMIGTNSDITLRKQADMQIENLAFYDQLTALPNRRLLFDRMAQMVASTLRSKHYGALIFIDLDDFKTLNDTLGHNMGDSMLLQVARRLSSSVRRSDTVARLGGDEFVVVIQCMDVQRDAAAAEAAAVCEKLLATISLPCMLGDNEYRGSASIGITLFGGEQIEPDVLMGQADCAMYLAKSDGRDTYRFFDAQLLAAITARSAFETDLRMSIKHNELHLVYQPQLHSDGRVIGAEALVRWSHPVRGAVAPGEFIPVAEKSSFIVELGLWVLRQACQTLQAWSRSSLARDLPLAVNVSAKQFLQAGFVSQVIEILTQTGANPARLKLELTETIFANDVDGIAEKMAQLKHHGVSFSLDDFGTGYSSLSYIKRLPFDQIKIDQSFVRDVLADPNDAAIVRTVVALCHSLSLSVIAEGVETLAQKEFLEKNECFAFQGYFFSQPLSLWQFDEFLSGNRAAMDGVS